MLPVPGCVIARRLRGPAGAATDGFASGSLAALLGGTVDVELTVPDAPTPDPSVGGSGGQVWNEAGSPPGRRCSVPTARCWRPPGPSGSPSRAPP